MPISYTKRGWTNNSPPAINAANLGAMDDGLKNAIDALNNMGDAGQLAVKEIGAAPASTTGGKLVNKITEAGYSLAPATGASNLDNIADGTSYKRVQAAKADKINTGTYSEDDIVDGTSYARVQKAKADAINGGTFDAASVSAYGIGGVSKNVGVSPNLDNYITNGFFACSGIPTSSSTRTFNTGLYLLQVEAYSSSFVLQKLYDINDTGTVYNRYKYNAAWSDWFINYGFFVNGQAVNNGQPPAPKPTTSAIIGQWVVLATDSAGDVYLPSGGTWAYFTCYIAGSGAAVASVAAGGTKVRAYGSNLGYVGFAWRIA